VRGQRERLKNGLAPAFAWTLRMQDEEMVVHIGASRARRDGQRQQRPAAK
jgi:hypothetical protein